MRDRCGRFRKPRVRPLSRLSLCFACSAISLAWALVSNAFGVKNNNSLPSFVREWFSHFPMIHFRCWYCKRAIVRPEEQAGSRFACSCGRRAKVPRRSGGSSKVRSLTDWFVEALVYGGAGALVGFALSVAIFSRIPLFRRPIEVTIAMTAFGLLVGTLFGERGINWLGQKLRDRENG